jgi:hypothetical protein
MTKKKDIVIHEGESREIIIYRDSDNAPARRSLFYVMLRAYISYLQHIKKG